MGRSIKLLGKCKNEDNQVVASVAPRLLAPDHPLFNVSGVVNGILVRGNMVGDLVFIGSGAGKLPTASAVVSDVAGVPNIALEGMMLIAAFAGMYFSYCLEVPGPDWLSPFSSPCWRQEFWPSLLCTTKPILS